MLRRAIRMPESLAPVKSWAAITLPSFSSLLQFCGCNFSGRFDLRPALDVLRPGSLIQSKPRLLGGDILALSLHTAAERHQIPSEDGPEPAWQRWMRVAPGCP